VVERTPSHRNSSADLLPAQVLTHVDPGWIERLSDVDVALLPYYFDLWLRPEQHIPSHRWNTCGFTGGRGFGKSMSIARWVNARVMDGLETCVALAAPNDDRVDEVQIQALIGYAEPWQRPERYRGGLRWPNGVQAIAYSSEAPERGRGDNMSLSWCTEIVAWKPATREDFFKNLYTATRIGEARMVWDSTAKGRNEVRALLEQMNEYDPEHHVILPGTTFDNPLLSTAYLRGQWRSYAGVRREEELLGKSFRESAGALWKQSYFDATRVAEVPASGLEWFVVCVDPATSTDESADETGIVAGGRGRDGHAYATDDASGKWGPNEWGDKAIDLAHPRRAGAGRIGIERKKIGDNAAFVIKSRAENRNLRTRMIGKDEPWPAWDPGCIFIREYNPQESKGARAEGPAAETEAGRVHLIDPDPSRPRFADLEKECTTYVQGTTKRSPNRLDAFAYLVTELRELRRDSPPDHARDAAAAVAMQSELDARLRGGRGASPTLAGGGGFGGAVGGGRRMGL
jgi:phage terminase large subunit-like protein